MDDACLSVFQRFRSIIVAAEAGHGQDGAAAAHVERVSDAMEKHGYLDIQSDTQGVIKIKRNWVMLLKNVILIRNEPGPDFGAQVLAKIGKMEMKPLEEPNECSFVIKQAETDWKLATLTLTAVSKEERDEWVSAIMVNFAHTWATEMMMRWFPWTQEQEESMSSKEHYLALQDIFRVANQIRHGRMITASHMKQVYMDDDDETPVAQPRRKVA